MNLFTRPTLVTLTAPTCAGKSHLLEALALVGFERIVSTTDRAPRAGEIEGVHYHFITTEQSKRLEANNMFAELVTYNGTRYGVTHDEMNRKMSGNKPPMVILEPTGLGIYRQYCASKGWGVFSIYVQTPEDVRLQRLVNRTSDDIFNIVYGGETSNTKETFKKIQKIVGVNNKRLQAVFEQECRWLTTNIWDVQADGTNLDRAMEQIQLGIKAFNAKADVRGPSGSGDASL